MLCIAQGLSCWKIERWEDRDLGVRQSQPRPADYWLSDSSAHALVGLSVCLLVVSGVVKYKSTLPTSVLGVDIVAWPGFQSATRTMDSPTACVSCAWTGEIYLDAVLVSVFVCAWMAFFLPRVNVMCGSKSRPASRWCLSCSNLTWALKMSRLFRCWPCFTLAASE